MGCGGVDLTKGIDAVCIFVFGDMLCCVSGVLLRSYCTESEIPAGAAVDRREFAGEFLSVFASCACVSREFRVEHEQDSADCGAGDCHSDVSVCARDSEYVRGLCESGEDYFDVHDGDWGRDHVRSDDNISDS
jgi:hypothetical protein